MSSDQFLSEHDYYSRRRLSRSARSGRAWAKHHLEFWHRCTIESDDGDSISVVLDNMDELTLAQDCVRAFDLEPGDLVFHQAGDFGIGGYPGFVISAKSEAVELEFPGTIYPKTERAMCQLRDIHFYHNLAPTNWKAGTRVFAYKQIVFRPALFLLFPAIVKAVHYDVCVEVEFGDGESAVVPTTLVEPHDPRPGDFVHTCTSFASHGTNPDERWDLCRVVERNRDRLILKDADGAEFQTPISMIARLPNGFRMINGNFERIPTTSAAGSRHTALEPLSADDVYIVRTTHWRDAAEDPITKTQLDLLMAADDDLAWGQKIKRTPSYWRGSVCFWWTQTGIRYATPTFQQLQKMIDMAIELDANVIGDDGKEYH